ncbi:MAG: hypothetical protein IPK67_17680 [Planctomycetes bacterium]|nr:hypothetical protein [Planctomycetota bacterium]
MHGSLSLRAGVLYVGRHADTAHVRAYDLDGVPLGAGFSFRARDGHGGARVDGLAVDRDRTLWIADRASSSVRVFSVFGRESGGIEFLRGAPPSDTRGGEDRRGDLSGICDVALLEDSAEEAPGEDRLLVTCGGTRRHGLAIARLDGTWVRGLRPEGHPLGHFRGLTRAKAHGRWIFACESGAGRVQVFRDGEFHFSFCVPGPGGGRLEPAAAAPLADGRWVLALRGATSALVVVDAGGRVVRTLAEAGRDTGAVDSPEDVVVEPASDLSATRIAVLDRDAERVQVFTVEGRCYGALEPLPGELGS